MFTQSALCTLWVKVQEICLHYMCFFVDKIDKITLVYGLCRFIIRQNKSEINHILLNFIQNEDRITA